VHFKYEQPEVLSRDSHVTIKTIQKKTGSSQRVVSISTQIVGMRLDQRLYWDSWKLVGRPWHDQTESD